MPLQLMKLLVTASTTTTVGANPEKFFHVTAGVTAAGAALTIDTADFFDETGLVAANLPALAASNSYYKVFINGVLQMEGITAYTAGATTVGSLVVNVPAGGEPIPVNTPIVLEVVNYSPTSTTNIST